MLRVTAEALVTAIALDRPPANALTTEFVVAIRQALAAATADGARCIVLTGRPGMFSGGLDVPALLPLGPAAMSEFWREFFRLNQALLSSPVPVVAALSGHAPAGGTVLALCCDYRIAASGDFRMGLNEVAVGLPVPDTIIAAAAALVGLRLAHRLTMTAELVVVAEALRLGLVDEVVAPDALAARAQAFAARLAALPPVALNQTRAAARADLLTRFDLEASVQRATAAWFSPETQAGMQALVARLAKR
jgi:enoyl-CoA hydratase/carnithine racemase